MLKRKDRLDFYPCVADAVLGTSDHACHKHDLKYKNPSMHGNAAACVHTVNLALFMFLYMYWNTDIVVGAIIGIMT